MKLRDLMPEWKWSLGMMYCYGLRPSEVFGSNVNQPDKTCNVLGLKGEDDELEERTAFTLDKSLVDTFDLNNIDRLNLPLEIKLLKLKSLENLLAI